MTGRVPFIYRTYVILLPATVTVGNFRPPAVSIWQTQEGSPEEWLR